MAVVDTSRQGLPRADSARQAMQVSVPVVRSPRQNRKLSQKLSQVRGRPGEEVPLWI